MMKKILIAAFITIAAISPLGAHAQQCEVDVFFYPRKNIPSGTFINLTELIGQAIYKHKVTLWVADTLNDVKGPKPRLELSEEEKEKLKSERKGERSNYIANFDTNSADPKLVQPVNDADKSALPKGYGTPDPGQSADEQLTSYTEYGANGQPIIFNNLNNKDAHSDPGFGTPRGQFAVEAWNAIGKHLRKQNAQETSDLSKIDKVLLKEGSTFLFDENNEKYYNIFGENSVFRPETITSPPVVFTCGGTVKVFLLDGRVRDPLPGSLSDAYGTIIGG